MGLANIVGAGIFVIIGKSTKYGGNKTILGILLMATISMIAGFCYIEIYSRFQSNITEYLSVQRAMATMWANNDNSHIFSRNIFYSQRNIICIINNCWSVSDYK